LKRRHITYQIRAFDATNTKTVQFNLKEVISPRYDYLFFVKLS